MATIERLTRRPDFLAAAEGRRFHTERMTAQGRLRDAQDPPGLRLGFTITKRVGHAPERNRIRRRLRAVVSLVAADLAADLARLPADIVLIARRPALDGDFLGLAEDLRRAIPVVTRPREPGGDRPAGGSRSQPSRRGSGTRPARDAGTDTAPSQGHATEERFAGAPRPDPAGSDSLATPLATSNACGGVPDGQ